MLQLNLEKNNKYMRRANFSNLKTFIVNPDLEGTRQSITNKRVMNRLLYDYKYIIVIAKIFV